MTAGGVIAAMLLIMWLLLGERVSSGKYRYGNVKRAFKPVFAGNLTGSDELFTVLQLCYTGSRQRSNERGEYG